MLLTRVSAKAPRIALQMPKRNRKPSTNQAAILKQATAIMKVKIPDNKSKVAKFGITNKTLRTGLTSAVIIPKIAAEKIAFSGVSISTPKGNLLIIHKLTAVTNQTISSVVISITRTPQNVNVDMTINYLVDLVS